MPRRRHERPLPRTNPSGERVFVARFTGPDGKRRSAGTFSLKREAQAAIDAAYDDPVAHRSLTVEGYAATWLHRHPRSERTNAGYEARLRASLPLPVAGKRPLGKWPLTEIRRRHANDLVTALLAEGRAAAGVQGIVSTLNAMVEDALNEELLEVNPFIRVKVRQSDPRVKKPARPTRLYSWEQMHAVCAASPEEAMLRVLADCGLRLGELLALHRADDRGDHLWVHRRAWEGRVQEGLKQGSSSRLNEAGERGRVVPVPPALRRLLDARPPRIDSKLMFSTPRGKVRREWRFYQEVWYPAQRATGLDCRPHEFRHSWVSLLRAAGVDPADLAAMAGHTVQTATGIYTHPLHASYDDVRRLVG